MRELHVPIPVLPFFLLLKLPVTDDFSRTVYCGLVMNFSSSRWASPAMRRAQTACHTQMQYIQPQLREQAQKLKDQFIHIAGLTATGLRCCAARIPRPQWVWNRVRPSQ